jgi:hypothetical protein
MCHHRAVHRDGFEQTHGVASIAAILRQPDGVARKVFVSGSAESGTYLVRMLVLGGQPADAASFIAAARDDAVRNSGTDAEAEALAEIGDPATALPLANTITDPVLRARALAAVADTLKN